MNEGSDTLTPITEKDDMNQDFSDKMKDIQSKL